LGRTANDVTLPGELIGLSGGIDIADQDPFQLATLIVAMPPAASNRPPTISWLVG
jgi:hypothetical protein